MLSLNNLMLFELEFSHHKNINVGLLIYTKHLTNDYQFLKDLINVSIAAMYNIFHSSYLAEDLVGDEVTPEQALEVELLLQTKEYQEHLIKWQEILEKSQNMTTLCEMDCLHRNDVLTWVDLVSTYLNKIKKNNYYWLDCYCGEDINQNFLPQLVDDIKSDHYLRDLYPFFSWFEDAKNDSECGILSFERTLTIVELYTIAKNRQCDYFLK